jgi:outer membrane protein assembly factor BamB
LLDRNVAILPITPDAENSPMRFRYLGLLVPMAVIACTGAEPAKPATPGKYDWPQWRGPDRTHVSKETGLLQEWPKGGPKLAWRVNGVGEGFSTPSIACGRIFLMGNVDRKECVLALGEKDGGSIWSTPIGPAGEAGGYRGPRSTPTVDGDRLYALGVRGDLVCLDIENGKQRWTRNMRKDFEGRGGGWGYCESVLIDGDKLICTPGGKNALVALNKQNGDVIWKARVKGDDGAAYASAIVAEIGGVKQYIQFMSGGVVSVAAEDGKFLWRYDRPRNGTANCSTPLYSDGHVFAASGYGTGGGLAEINVNNGDFSAHEVYFTQKMRNHHGGMVLIDGYLYGADDSGQLTCIEFKTGKVMWQNRGADKGAVFYADHRLYCRNEGNGRVILVEANPSKFVEHGRLDQPDRTGQAAWPHPVVANGRLYLRDQDLLLCYDVKVED